MITVHIDGLEELIEKLTWMDDPTPLRRAMTKSTAHLQNNIAEYPSSSNANSPGSGYSWYERGFGTRTRTGRAYPTSETLGRRWTSEVSANGRKGVVGNNASYGPYVQSEEKQAGFHKRRGWQTDVSIADKEGDKVVAFFEAEIDEALQ